MPPDNKSRSLRTPFTYPAARRIDCVETLHGQKVSDPYRWLETSDSPETHEWIEAQNKLSGQFLAGIPEREGIEKRLLELWNYERYGVPFSAGGRYFFFKNDGLQNQSVLYVAESLTAEPRILLDPNGLSDDGTVSVADVEVNRDGTLLAYGISQAGSDWVEWKVRNALTGEDLPDRLERIKFSGVSWNADGTGFFYSRYDLHKDSKPSDPDRHQKLYFHKLGDPQTKDQLVYERPDQSEYGFDGHVTEDGHYLLITVWKGTDHRNLLFWKDLREPQSRVQPLVEEFFAHFAFFANQGSIFYFRTDFASPRGRVVSRDVSLSGSGDWREVIPQSAQTLEGATFLNGYFLAQYLRDARSEVSVFDSHGVFQRHIPLPGLGSSSGFSGKSTDRETFFQFTSPTRPATLYRLDLDTWEVGVFKEPRLRFNPDDFESRQFFYASRDGTHIPVLLTSLRGLPRNGNNPVYLYGYGGFNVNLTPFFSVPNLVWMEMGGMIAIPNIRGGGEYGEEWHQAGILANKIKGFEDFEACAEWLTAEKYTCPGKLALSGGSNGGLLVGACILRRPELFAAALPAVGVFDMLRFHKFTIGWAWMSDYGDPEKAEDFNVLFSYSPLHNVKPGTAYPATLITTADHDDRVVPLHSFKFAAALQHAQAGAQPILIRIEARAGHGAGKPLTKVVEESADRLSFLVRVLEVSPRP